MLVFSLTDTDSGMKIVPGPGGSFNGPLKIYDGGGNVVMDIPEGMSINVDPVELSSEPEYEI